MNSTEILIERHFQKKPGENLDVLRDRYRQISQFHKDPLTAALLATSYYGMEELKMRLPKLNEILRNPFSVEEYLHAVTGLILLADGGPAEGAKAIQICMALGSRGIEVDDTKTHHLISMLAIASHQAMPLVGRLVEDMDAEKEKKEAFHEAASNWIREQTKLEEEAGLEDSMAYALLVGMKEEVETILDEEL
ncbi:MAG: hypothetical protein IJH60_06905 [Eubacterium sp.]|nr:hypothetical protein [Eubacterium sp.]